MRLFYKQLPRNETKFFHPTHNFTLVIYFKHATLNSNLWTEYILPTINVLVHYTLL